MRSLLNILLAVIFLGLVTSTAPAAHTQAQLLLPVESARPGSTIVGAIRLKMDPEWHTYWKNSGSSGIPTTNEWHLPAGIIAGEIQWPVPLKLPPDDLTTYVYENEVLLLVPLTLAADLKPGPLELKTAVTWLECKEQCISNGATVTAKLNIGTETKASTDAELIQAWQKKLPGSADNLSPQAAWEQKAANDARALVLEWDSTNATSTADFFPYYSDSFEVQAEVQRLPSEAGKIRLRKLVKKFDGDWPKQIAGLLIEKTESETLAHEATLPIAGSLSSPTLTANPLDQPLWKMLLYALVGGIILNIMPCVLPVIALKILGFISESKSDPRHIRKLGLLYALGVLVSFLALAALVLGVKAAGHQAGWGMQFSNPQFIVVLTTLVTLVALNLFGVFEITLSGRVMGAAGNLAGKQGSAGAFFNGVLATVLATPCTAPFLGAALGFAFAQTAPITVLMFLTVGGGMALPYVLLSWQPAWMKFLPKPGVWMEKFKVAMGFPMLVTAVWLFSLVTIYYGDRSWWLGIFLIVVGLAAWVFGEFVQRGGQYRGMAGIITLILLLAGYVGIAEGRLDWRNSGSPTTDNGSLPKDGANGIEWQRWSRQTVAQARAEGRPVLVDFTAQWCLTCNTIIKPVLESTSVRKKIKELNVVTLLADYTRFPPEITAELAAFGRAGVPLVLVYPKNPEAAPVVLPEALTPGMVVEALDRVAK